jgi:hypothetical protein
MLTKGHGGIFDAGTTWPLDEVECLAIVEAPIDALSLAAADILSLATQPTSVRTGCRWHLLSRPCCWRTTTTSRTEMVSAPATWPRLAWCRRCGKRRGARPVATEGEELEPGLAGRGARSSAQDGRGRSVSELMPAVVELTVEQSWASPSELTPVVPEPRVEATVEADPGVQTVEQPERAKVDELLGWLGTADLPHEPFQLWPCRKESISRVGGWGVCDRDDDGSLLPPTGWPARALAARHTEPTCLAVRARRSPRASVGCPDYEAAAALTRTRHQPTFRRFRWARNEPCRRRSRPALAVRAAVGGGD